MKEYPSRVRVKITEGAWKGVRGTIQGPPLQNEAWPILLDSNVILTFFRSEFEYIP